MKKKLCNVHGIHTGAKCGKCRASSHKTYDNIFRNQDAKKFYNSKQWLELRDVALKNNPLCSCGKPAQVVDHIEEISDGGEKLALKNLEPMCHACHNKKTAEAKARRAGGGKITGVRSPTDRTPHTKNRNSA